MKLMGPRWLWLALGLLLPFPSLAQTAEVRVVYHVDFDQRSKQISALQMMQNHIDAVKPGRVELVVLLQGDGVSLLLEPEALGRVRGFDQANGDQEMTAMIDHLRDQGVHFLISGSTLTRRQVNAERDLYHADPGDIVDNGIAELVRRQEHGFIYLKP